MHLHKEKGLNPRLTKCPQCFKDTDEILLLGKDNTLYNCLECNRYYIGTSSKCPMCNTYNTEKLRELSDNERIPHSLCKKCKKEQDDFEKEIELGGVHFKCKCGAGGIIKHDHEIAKKTREVSNIKAPKPVGISLNHCPICFKGI